VDVKELVAASNLRLDSKAAQVKPQHHCILVANSASPVLVQAISVSKAFTSLGSADYVSRKSDKYLRRRDIPFDSGLGHPHCRNQSFSYRPGCVNGMIQAFVGHAQGLIVDLRTRKSLALIHRDLRRQNPVRFGARSLSDNNLFFLTDGAWCS
jgi:hypothetical protein